MDWRLVAVGMVTFVAWSSQAAQPKDGDLYPVVENISWPRLRVKVVNATKEPVRLWKDSNSWGHYKISVCLVQKNGKVVQIKRRPVAFTRNVPEFFETGPGESSETRIDLKDGYWTLPDGLDLEDWPPFVSVVLCVESTPEAKELKTWVGTRVSEWVDVPKKGDIPVVPPKNSVGADSERTEDKRRE